MDIELVSAGRNIELVSAGQINQSTIYKADGGCLIKAKCFRSMKKNESPHSLEVMIRNEPLMIDHKETKCSCVIGASGSCGHVCGLLYTLAHLKAIGAKSVPMDIAKTSLPQTWHMPRGEKIGPSSSDDVKLHGYSKIEPSKKTRGLRSTVYNPLINSTALPSYDMLASDVRDINPSCLLLSVLGTSNSMVQTKFGKFPKGSTLGHQQKIHSHYVLNILDAEEFPPLPIRNVMINKLEGPLIEEQELKVSSLGMSVEEVQSIEISTRLQNQDPKWHSLRRDRLTASICGDIVKRKADDGPLVARLKTTRTVMTSSMRHGVASEPIAADAYCNALEGAVNIYPCGIIISPYSPWLAASPDRKVFLPSRTPTFGLLEIKCPVNSLAECKYLSRDSNGGFQLKKNHNYYYQVMMQLAVTGLEWCDFFVWKEEEHHLETITFNSSEWETMKDRLDLFYFNSFI